MPTLDPRDSKAMNFHIVTVRSLAAALKAAFKAGTMSARHDRASLDFDQLLEERRQIAIVWSIDDVQEVRSDLNPDQAWQVLRQCQRVHDCEFGITWQLIETVAEDLFGSNPSDE
ncbi:MAG TPA: hypothetical protein VGN12_28065 [Pirellulales bacterium]